MASFGELDVIDCDQSNRLEFNPLFVVSKCEMEMIGHDRLCIYNRVSYLTYLYTWVTNSILRVHANPILSLRPNHIHPTK